ncbi:hypothetical protein JVT61DRAFT_7074 [Boletus reticuloceps]|uniref:Uncharacterized protein n=1 Tax=Boletus reticuloceps TaxID=495285 RepID=A0A8I2YJE2_9AGAM|nr:hypothetical protein JVT61DRAFT_7074 [Boletus reticuloceps]
MKKLTSHAKQLSSNLNDIRKSQPDIPSISKIKPDLSNVRKIAPNLNDLRKTFVPDMGKLQEISLGLEKVTGRLPDLGDFGNMAKRWGDMSKLIPGSYVLCPLALHSFGSHIHSLKLDQEWEIIVAPPPHYEQVSGLQHGWPGGNDKDGSPQAEVTLSESQEKEGFKKIQDVLNAPKTHKSLQESMEDLKDSVAGTVLAFKRVGAALAEATADANELYFRLSEMWSTHQKEFVRLLRMSRETACRARGTANKFAFDLATKLGDDALSTDEKNEKIREYRANLEVEIDQSKDLAQGFLDLHTQITYFQEEITAWMKKGDKFKEDILKLAADIKKAKEGIEKLTRRALLSASSALGLGILSAGAIALGILCPLLWIAAAFASIEVVKDGKAAWDNLLSRNNQKDKLQNAESEMDEKLASLDEFKRIQVILGPALSDLNLICDKLWVISEIWTFIRADLVGIERKMSLAKGSSLLFKARLKTAALTYSLLSDALNQYEAEIGKLDLE